MRGATLALAALAITSVGAASSEAQSPPPGASPGGPPAGAAAPGGLAGGGPNAPPNLFNAPHRLARSPLRQQWVYIPQAGKPPLRTFIIEPAGEGPAPVVIFMHYDAGLDPVQQGLVAALATNGFMVVAPDLLSGLGPDGGNYDSFAFPDAALRAMLKVPLAEAMRQYKLAHSYAARLPRAGKIGSFGSGVGGAHSFQFAAEMPELGAAVVYYGLPPRNADLAKVRAPVLGLYGGDDPAVTGTVEATAATMKTLGKSYEAHTYPGATRSFLTYAVEGENGPATAASWARALAFLKSQLTNQPGRPGQ